jgi:hypothetical protein
MTETTITTAPPLPVALRPAQTPTPAGIVPRLMMRLFGLSWRTTVTSLASALALIAGTALTVCPHLVAGQWDRAEAVKLVFALVGGGGMAATGHFAKDRIVTGVE